MATRRFRGGAGLPPAGGGGHRQTVLQQKVVTLNDAEFRALPSTPFEIVPAQGPGTIIRWLGAWIVLDNSAGAYNGPSKSGAYLQVVHLASPFPIETSGFIWLDAPMQQAGIWSGTFPPFGGYNSSDGYLYHQPSNIGTAIQNVGLAIADVYNGQANYVGGDPSNTLQVSMLYAIVRL